MAVVVVVVAVSVVVRIRASDMSVSIVMNALSTFGVCVWVSCNSEVEISSACKLSSFCNVSVSVSSSFADVSSVSNCICNCVRSPVNLC